MARRPDLSRAEVLARCSSAVRERNPKLFGALAAAATRRAVKRARPAAVPIEPPNLPWSFTIVGAPRTKNTGKSPRPGVVIPSAAYRRWFHAAIDQLPIIRVACRGTATAPVDVTAIFYRDRNVGDEDRFTVALGDWLQRSGLVLNDSLIHWDARRELDRANPRIEVRITTAAGDFSCPR